MPLAKRFRKRPIEVEAVMLTHDNHGEVRDWCGGQDLASPSGRVSGVVVQTMDGPMNARYGYWVVKVARDVFYPCPPDDFAVNYEEIRR